MQDQNETASAPEAESAAGNPPPNSAANDPAPAVPGLEELLEKAETAAQEHRDAWLRAKADADNIRKRAQSDLANAHKYALENFSAELIPVRDSLEAALATQNAAPEALRSGVELTLKQLTAAFEKFSRAYLWALTKSLCARLRMLSASALARSQASRCS